jgi:hypothetical protein
LIHRLQNLEWQTGYRDLPLRHCRIGSRLWPKYGSGRMLSTSSGLRWNLLDFNSRWALMEMGGRSNGRTPSSLAERAIFKHAFSFHTLWRHSVDTVAIAKHPSLPGTKFTSAIGAIVGVGSTTFWNRAKTASETSRPVSHGLPRHGSIPACCGSVNVQSHMWSTASPISSML